MRHREICVALCLRHEKMKPHKDLPATVALAWQGRRGCVTHRKTAFRRDWQRPLNRLKKKRHKRKEWLD
jgi:hypothetical protein